MILIYQKFMHRLLLIALLLGLAGCATQSLPPSPSGPLPPEQPRPPTSRPVPPPGNGQPGTLQSPAVSPSTPAPPAEREVRVLINRLLPDTVKDRSGWSGDLYSAFAKLGLPHAAPVYCAAIAVIEQESSFQSDPVVPGLPAMVRKELEARGSRYGIPKLVISTALLKSGPDGRSYSQRIDSLKTEKQLNSLFDDMIAELPFGKRLFADYNPVRTGGPMQVSVAFAETHARERAYPYPLSGSIRNEVFSRRGGLYFGSAILLDYPAPYDEVVYRFADFNAGRYSSRNAAFQSALGKLSGQALTLDGDLLRYSKGQPSAEISSVEAALRQQATRLRLSHADIRRDLLLEKTAAFGQSPSFIRTFAAAEQSAGRPLPRQAMPQIDLHSPKITRQLTTEWFARRVEERFRRCLGRSAPPASG